MFCVLDILRFDILLSDILSRTRSNHTDAVGRAVNVLTEAAGSMFGDTERSVYRRAAAITRHLCNAQLGDLRNASLV